MERMTSEIFSQIFKWANREKTSRLVISITAFMSKRKSRKWQRILIFDLSHDALKV